MTAVNLHKNLSPEETIRRWMTRVHPRYPSELVRVWEDEIQPDLANPVTDVYNVVFFCDPEYQCLRVMGMALYGSWQVQDPFPEPAVVPEAVPFVATGPMPVVKVDGEEVATLDELKQRIDWILQTHGEVDSPWVQAGDLHKEAVTRQTIAMVPQEWVKEWYLWRAKAERLQWSRICERGVDEARAVALMKGIPIIQATKDDIQCHLRAFPQDRGTITQWWQVGAHEIDASLLQTLPLYRGYKVHINFRHVGSYLSGVMERRERSYKTRIWTTPPHRILPPETLWVAQLTDLSEYIHERSIRRVKKRAKVSYEAVDIEDIVLAPCMASLVGGGRFPQDQERQYLVRTLRAAKVPVERVGAMLDDLNERYPHEGKRYGNAKQRWDYVAHYEKGYKAPSCQDMEGYCPYSGSVDQRKAQCHKVFQDTHNDCYRVGDEQRFYNPASWIYWGRRRAQSNQVDSTNNNGSTAKEVLSVLDQD